MNKNRRANHPRLNAKAIGRRIARTRKAYGWTQRKLASVAGLSRHIIIAFETGNRLPSRDSLVVLAAALRRKTDWILFGGRDFWWRRRFGDDESPIGVAGRSRVNTP